jgi:tagatose-1,6-bisphosphate aldolase non-catalytic subunit AgaZ/GatZ
MVEADARQAAVDAKLADVQKQNAEATDRLQQLSALEQTLKQAQATLEENKQALASKQEEFKRNVQLTRELFSKDGLGDVFDKVTSKEVQPFLVTTLGFAEKKYITYVRKAIISADVKKTDSYKVSALSDDVGLQLGVSPKIPPGPNMVDDQFLIYGTPDQVKALRDNLNKFLNDENKVKGVKAEQVAIFVVVRPILKVRVGMKLPMIIAHCRDMRRR